MSQISFADWELLQQGILLEPLLQSISDFLDDHKEMIEAVRRDLQRGLKNPGTGRNGLAPQQVLRSHPTDNTLLWDVVRVVTRLIGRLAEAVQQRIRGFRKRTRAARRRMQEIQRLTPKQQYERQTKKYRELIGVTEEVVDSAQRVVAQTRKARGKNLVADLAIGELRKEIDHYCELGERVIDQARRRVLQGEQVPNTEKIYSIFESHTDLIKRGKVQTPLEFGHKVFLAESAQGLITQYQVLEGNPCDEQKWNLPWNTTRKPLATPPNCMVPIGASLVRRM